MLNSKLTSTAPLYKELSRDLYLTKYLKLVVVIFILPQPRKQKSFFHFNTPFYIDSI